MRLINADALLKTYEGFIGYDEEIETINQQPTIDAVPREQVIETIQNAELNFSIESDIDLTKHKKEIQEIIDNILKAQIKAIMEL